jgi:hypothetical protein
MVNSLKYILISAIIILLAIKYYYLTKRESTIIDEIGEHLITVKKLLPVNSTIGFYSNGTVDSAKVVYSYAVFWLHPITVKVINADTILLLIDKKYPAKDFSKYTILSKSEDSRFVYSLIRKNK